MSLGGEIVHRPHGLPVLDALAEVHRVFGGVARVEIAMEGGRFRAHHRVARLGETLEGGREWRVLDLGARGPEGLEGGIDLRAIVRLGALHERAQHSEPRRGGRRDGADIVIEGHGDRMRVGGIVAGHDGQGERRVLHRAAQDTDMIQAPRQRHHAHGADAPVRRLEAHDAAVGGGTQHRAHRLGAEGEGDHPRPDGGSRAARRSARRVRRIPRIPRLRRIAEGEGGRRHLAENHRAGPSQPGHRDGIDGGAPVRPRPRPRGGHQPRGVVDVLEGHGHAVERAHEAPLAGLDIPLHGDARGGIAIEMHPGLEGGLEGVDALEAGGEEVGRRQRARANAARRLGGAHVVEVGHGFSCGGGGDYWSASRTSATTSKRPKEGMR